MKPFTIHYSQPDEYRFSLDSVETPWLVAQELSRIQGSVMGSPLRVLDLCAGCGVMGLELAFHLPLSLQIDFVEIQSVYRPHFEINLHRLQESDRSRGFGRTLETRWLEKNYETLVGSEFRGRYDLILANPPYFEEEQGRLSAGDFKSRCRFFVDSTAEKLWDVIATSLAPRGTAYLLLRSQSQHGENIFSQLERRLRYETSTEIWQSVRGTDLVRLRSRS